MYYRLLFLGETDPQTLEGYHYIIWALAMLVGAWIFAVVIVRIIHLIWSRSYKSDATGNDLSDETIDPWKESARRMQIEPESDEDDEENYDENEEPF